MVRARGPLVLACGIALAHLTAVRFAQAHAVGLSSGEYTVEGGEVVGRLILSQQDAEGLDAERLVRDIEVSSDGKPCTAVLDEIGAAPPAGVAYRARFLCDPPRQRIELQLRAAFFDRLLEGHRHAIRLQQGTRSVEEVLYRRHDDVTLAVDGTPPKPRSDVVAGMGALLRMGLEHILSGYDHLLFLVGLVLVGGSVRSMLAVVTAFTLAHSITLGVATLGVWAPPPWIVEPAIALSIAYVGVENFFISDIRGRWRVTFPFGLLHGFGFAGALRAVEIPRSELPASLLSFNVGVELGQLAVLAIVLPALACLRRSRGFAGASRMLSAAVIATGALWFVVRIAHART